jgi:hypothetical protein
MWEFGFGSGFPLLLLLGRDGIDLGGDAESKVNLVGS